MKVLNIYPAIPALDIERALKFYKDQLGLRVTQTLSDTLGMYLVGNDETNFLLFQRKEKTLAEHTVISFSVENINNTVLELEQKGIEFYTENGQKIFDLEGSQSAWFKDSEGNSFEISQRNF